MLNLPVVVTVAKVECESRQEASVQYTDDFRRHRWAMRRAATPTPSAMTATGRARPCSPLNSRRTAADSILGRLVHDALPFSNARTEARSRTSAAYGNCARWSRQR